MTFFRGGVDKVEIKYKNKDSNMNIYSKLRSINKQTLDLESFFGLWLNIYIHSGILILDRRGYESFPA